VRIFLCHASEQHSLAARLATVLRGQAHKVFLDRDDLPPGNSFDDRIRQAIKKSQLFIFLVSPNAVEKNAYTLSELKFAREKWPSQADHILPIMVIDTPFDSIPAYISGLTIMRPEGNLIAEVLAETEKIRHRYRMRQVFIASSWTIAISLSLLLVFYIFGTERIGPFFGSLIFPSPTPSETTDPHTVQSSAGKCLDVNAPDQSLNGGKVQVWDCNGSPQQTWALNGRSIKSAAGKCLDVHAPDQNTNGARVQVWDCNGSPQQAWRIP
jgi:hypothetical protein